MRLQLLKFLGAAKTMKIITAETRIRTSMQVSIDKILSEKGLSDLFYKNYVTGFYLIIDQYSFLGIRLVLERMGKKISVIYDFCDPPMGVLESSQHRDIEMKFCFPSWKPLSLEHHHFNMYQFARTIENYHFPLPPKTYLFQLNEFSRMWAKHIHNQEWDKVTKYEFGYRIEGRWHRSRIRER
jgi:hypothetical protein